MKIRFQWKKSPYLLVLMGLLGFFTGHAIIFGVDAFNYSFTPKPVFSEIRFTPSCPQGDTLCGKILSFAGNENKELVITCLQHDTVTKTRRVRDTITRDGKIDSAWVSRSYTADTVVTVTLTQAELEKDYKKVYPSDIDFFRQNPVFTVWAIFIIAMFAMWFMSFFPLLYLNREMVENEKFKPLGLWKKRVWYFVFPLLVLAVYHAIMLASFFDMPLFFATLFIPGWDIRFATMNLIGFVACGPIFMGMLYVYRMASEVKPTDKEGISYLEDKLKIFLLAISIGLSFVLITTSLLFTSVNQLSFIAKATKDLGKSPLNNELVIAYGVAYSVLIGIFYLPAALKLYHLRLLQVDATDISGDKKGFKVDGAVKNVLGEIFKSSAPLVTSIIGTLLGVIFQ